MKVFGPNEDVDPEICLERIPGASAHVLVFPERLSRVSDETLIRATAEYEQAKRNNVEVLAYVPADDHMISGLPLRRLYEHVRNCQSITVIDRNQHLWHHNFGRHISRDLDRTAQSNLDSEALESDAPLAAQHERVLEHLYAANLDTAHEVNQRVLTTHTESPRAHYNQACIYSWRAEDEKQSADELLLRAKRHFEGKRQSKPPVPVPGVRSPLAG